MQIDIQSSVCIFNPEYRLKPDRRRILLFSENVNSPLVEESNYNSFLYFQHPVFAILLSLFDGKKDITTICKDFCNLTGLSKDFVLTIISQLIENKSDIKIHFNGNTFFFPRKTLLKKKSSSPQNNQYNPLDFLIPSDQLDFTSHRLYIPLDTMFITSNRCATRCTYCYADKRESRPCTIPPERLSEIIREAASLGMRLFDISGGELFMYKHWKELLKELISNGFTPNIPTKFPLTSQHIKELKEIGIKQIQFSLDTIVKEEMTEMLQVNGKYHTKILRTLKELDENGFELLVNSQVTSINQNSTDQLIEYLLGLDNIKLIRIRATGYSMYKENYLTVRPSKKELEEIRLKIQKWKEKYQGKVELDFYEYPQRDHYISNSPEQKKKDYEKRSQCAGNFQAFFILPDGKVTICEELYYHPQFIIGDLMKQSIMDVWTSDKALSLYHFSKEAVRTKSPCKTCEDFNRCHQEKGLCWKQAMYAYGENNWDYPDPRCHLAPEPENVIWID